MGKTTDEKTSLQLSNHKRKLAIAAVALGTFMSALDSSVVNIALPNISAHFNTNLSTIEWVVMSYLLIISSLLITYGRMGDMYGHKKVYVRGFIIFTLGSFLCGISPNIIILIISRIIQAIGAGMLMSMSSAIITNITPPEERGKSLGIIAVSVSIALATGPVIGGILTSLLGWESIFYINIPIGIFGCFFAEKVIPKSTIIDKQPFDIKGSVLIFASLITILLPLSYTETYGWENPYIITSLIGGIMLLGLFILVEKKTQYPMMDLTMFKNKLFSMSNLSALLSFIAQFSVILIMPFYLQQLRGLPPSKAGFLMIPMPLTTMFIAPISGAISDRIDSRYISALGMAIASFGIYLLSNLKIGSSHSYIAMSLMITGLGTGLFQTPNNSAIMGSVANNRRGIASSILATMRNIGMVLGIAISGAIFSTHQNYLIRTLSTKGLNANEIKVQAFTGALHLAYTVGAAIAFAAIVTSLIKGTTKRTNK